MNLARVAAMASFVLVEKIAPVGVSLRQNPRGQSFGITVPISVVLFA